MLLTRLRPAGASCGERGGGPAVSAYLDLSWPVMAVAGLGLLLVVVRLSRRVLSASALRAARRPFVSLLVVARNKEGSIEGLVRGLLSCSQRNAGTATCELVVVDNRSTDQTPAILERLARGCSNMRTVCMADLRCGIDSAVELGLFMCSSPVVLMLDLDGQANPRTLLEAAEYLLGGKPGTMPAGGGALASGTGTGLRGTLAGRTGMGLSRAGSFQGKEQARSTSN